MTQEKQYGGVFPEGDMSETLCRFAPRTQQQYQAYVSAYQDQYRPGEEGYGQPADFVWSYCPAFELSRLSDPVTEWTQWYREELCMTAEDGNPHRYDDLVTWWLPSPAWEPLVLVEGAAKCGYFPWDGCHRIGVSCCAEQRTAPAIVGIRKMKKTYTIEPKRNELW